MIPHSIPINGRIAIIDDNVEQIRPLMNLFGRLQVPYVYYDSDPRNLPASGKAFNDVRILILDINLLGNTVRPDKELRAALVPVIDRIISDHNYPYILVYWSRHEGEHDQLVKDIFTNDLPTKAPVSFLSLQKSAYFGDDGEATEEKDQPDLFKAIEEQLKKVPVYGHILDWENCIHVAADRTLEEIFKLESFDDNWNERSSKLFYRLALAYSGKQINGRDGTGQVKSAFCTLNSIFGDTVEQSIFSYSRPGAKLNGAKVDASVTASLNKKLLLSDERNPCNKPGMVLKDVGKKRAGEFPNLVEAFLTKGKEAKKTLAIEEAKKTAVKVSIVVTPVCDYAQDKYIYNKIVTGLLLNSSFEEFVEKSSEAFFISPSFKLPGDEHSKILLLDFRHFLSLKNLKTKSFEPLFRVRQELLAEIQSKMTRHLNRQGILFVN
jgi:hypothetical protein